MGTRENYDKGPHHGSEAEGISAAYEKVRQEALREEREAMAGPESLFVADNDIAMKNPHGEFEHPSPMDKEAMPTTPRFDGPNGPGNSKGDGTIDPQGQQAGTEGGQSPSPPLKIGGRFAGSTLESADARKLHAARPTGLQPAGGEKPATPKGE